LAGDTAEEFDSKRPTAQGQFRREIRSGSKWDFTEDAKAVQIVQNHLIATKIGTIAFAVIWDCWKICKTMFNRRRHFHREDVILWT
jgi:hypothetical protein